MVLKPGGTQDPGTSEIYQRLVPSQEKPILMGLNSTQGM